MEPCPRGGKELRVIQIGVQLLTGFLLTLPFQSSSNNSPPLSKASTWSPYGASVVSTGFLIAPVSMHRFIFRRHAWRVTVDVAHRLAQVGLAMLAVATTGVVLLIFDVVAGPTAGWIAATITTLLLGGLWVVLAIRQRDDSGSS